MGDGGSSQSLFLLTKLLDSILHLTHLKLTELVIDDLSLKIYLSSQRLSLGLVGLNNVIEAVSQVVLQYVRLTGNSQLLERSSARLRCLQRRLARKQKGSRRREKARLAVAKAYEHISNQRHNFLHHVVNNILGENQTVVIEDLNVEGMMKNHKLANSIASCSWSEFFRILSYKSDWKGVNLIRIGRFEPSSKMCECGYVHRDLKLSDRIWTCPSCGAVNDRDLLAARNIKKFGLEKQNLLTQ